MWHIVHVMYFPLSSALIVANGWGFNNGIASVDAERFRDVAEIYGLRATFLQ